MATAHPIRGLAVVTGASSGIGLELGRCAASAGYDLIIAADNPALDPAASQLAASGARVTTVQADLATEDGVDRLLAEIAAAGRPIDLLFANAGHGLGHGFLDQDFGAIRHVIDTNITGTLYLIHRVGHDMRAAGAGRILITGSIAGFMPGAFQAVYNGTKAFLDNFAYALREELKESGVTVTCLMPGPTQTEFFERAGLLDTSVGQQTKDDPRDVARAGFDALMAGDAEVVAGWKNKLQTTIANVTPAEMLAKQHRDMAEPGSGRA